MKRTFDKPTRTKREWYGGLTDWDGVAYWPTFLLRKVPAPLRAELAADAATRDISVQDVIRQALCNHYNMDCPDVSYTNLGRKLTNPNILLRLQPKLTRRLRKDSAREGLPVRTLILQVLESHYEGRTP